MVFRGRPGALFGLIEIMPRIREFHTRSSFETLSLCSFQDQFFPVAEIRLSDHNFHGHPETRSKKTR